MCCERALLQYGHSGDLGNRRQNFSFYEVLRQYGLNSCMNSAHEEKQIRAATREWAEQFADHYQYAVTLTLKPYRNFYDHRGVACLQQLTPAIAWHTFASFQHRLNCEVFGHAARRYRKTLAFVPVLEGQQVGKLLHFHCAIGDVPVRVDAADFGRRVASAWHDTNFGNTQIDVRPYRAGWIGYITKELSSDGAEFGWEHVSLGTAPC